jgi:hypothetical protein
MIQDVLFACKKHGDLIGLGQMVNIVYESYCSPIPVDDHPENLALYYESTRFTFSGFCRAENAYMSLKFLW